MARIKVVGCFVLSMIFAAVAQATPIVSTSLVNNELTIFFTLGPQPTSNNAIQFFLSTVGVSGGATLSTTASLLEDSTLLGTGTVANAHFSSRFTSPTSFFAASTATTATINFAAVADGISNGMVTMRLVGNGTLFWNTDNVSAMTFGDAGGSAAFYPQITGVNVSTAVPDGASSLLLLAFGLLVIAGISSKIS